MCFASFLSGEFITAIVVNPPERKLAKRTTVHFLNKLLSVLWNLKVFTITKKAFFNNRSE